MSQDSRGENIRVRIENEIEPIILSMGFKQTTGAYLRSGKNQGRPGIHESIGNGAKT